MTGLRALRCVLVATITTLSSTVWAGVTINEIFYNAPDGLEDLQWIELLNDGDAPVDLSDWALDGGKLFRFPGSTTIGARGYLVVALDPKRFAEVYRTDSVARNGEERDSGASDSGASDHVAPLIGPLQRPLRRGGERVELTDASGSRIDLVRYQDEGPWPVSPDGYTASLERICPAAPGDVPENWAASPLSSVETQPGGTPGARNASHSATLPPVVEIESDARDILAPGDSLRIEVSLRGASASEVSLLYRVAHAGAEGEETALPMTRDAATGHLHATIPGQQTGALVRYRVRAVSADGAARYCPAEHDLRPTLSAFVHEPWDDASIPFGLILRSEADRKKAESDAGAESRRGFGGGASRGRGPRPNFGGFGRSAEVPRTPRGSATFVHVSPGTKQATVHDHIHVIARNNDRGFRVFFHKDRPLNGMRSLNLIFEGSEWSLLAEPLAYDLYRRAGVPAPLTEFVRLWVDGRLVGYHLAVERVNRSFLRRNEVDDAGDLYKIRWTGRDIVGRHEKRTNPQTGHDELVSLIDRLEKSTGDAQWKLIQDAFHVKEVASYFAVNMVLSHWDGFFNNYFPYHDTKSGKWEMYPWDQDKTWGYYDGLPDDAVFVDMPLTFGMEGDRPPASGVESPRGRGRGPMWWRPGGHFSRPLLANPQFRAVFLARVREILDSIYTQEVYFPLIDSMARLVEEDVRVRAAASGREVEDARGELERNVGLLKKHLVERRKFLLESLEGATRSATDGPRSDRR